MQSRLRNRSPEVIGAILAVATGIVIFALPAFMARDLLAIVMTLIGAAYFGFAFSQSDRRKATVEVIVACFFVIVALLGLWVSMWFIVAGLFLHGIWDLLHHRPEFAEIPGWYIPFCTWYDWIACLLVALWLALQV